MNLKLKVGDKLFRVYGDPPEVEHVTIGRITSTKVWFTERAGMAFGCRTCLSTAEASTCPTSEVAAIEQHLADCQANVEAAREALKRAEALGGS